MGRRDLASSVPAIRFYPFSNRHPSCLFRPSTSRPVFQRARNRYPGSPPRNPHLSTQPLPADGAVAGYEFRIGDRRVVGEIGRRASSTRGATQELGNVPPCTEVSVELIVDQLLNWVNEGAEPGATKPSAGTARTTGGPAEAAAGGMWEWRFPSVLPPRYMGGLRRAKLSFTQLSTYFVDYLALSDIVREARASRGDGFDLRAFNLQRAPALVREHPAAPRARAARVRIRPLTARPPDRPRERTAGTARPRRSGPAACGPRCRSETSPGASRS